MVIAFAGRRIDAPDASVERFPARCVDAVARAMRERLAAEHARIVVASAACGGDLLLLSAAEQLGIHFRIVLPFGRALFRDRSVSDRSVPSKLFWTQPYDRLIAKAEKGHDLVEFDLDPDADRAYTRANDMIIDEALRLSKPQHTCRALVAWEKPSLTIGDTAGDHTAEFIAAARKRHVRILEPPLLTLF